MENIGLLLVPETTHCTICRS